ncbi:MAG: T9SS type A sorting domain-containing protein, partial [Thiotrichaceae bacterium]|nr:T9SS type A sorting domain-containing protein [Thiotrichaceae bacterium]
QGEESFELSTITTSTNFINTGYENSLVYPNPFSEQTTLQISSPKEDDIKILLINSLGQIVASTNQRITVGIHKFKISGKSAGIYTVTFISKTGRESHKAICTSKGNSDNNIEYKGLFSESVKEKSKLLEGGNLVHIELTSGDYKTIIADNPTESKTYDVEFMECRDKDGKTYKVVQIENQWWMAENLAYLPSVSPPSGESEIDPYYYVFGNQDTSVVEAKTMDTYVDYGVLYNWPAAKASCPSGWHLPSDGEWKQMEMAVGMSQVHADSAGWRGTNEGTKLRTTSGWHSDEIFDGTGTDDVGFSALPGGYRQWNGKFYRAIEHGVWWSSTSFEDTHMWVRGLGYHNPGVDRADDVKNLGFSVRCVRD